MGMLHKAGSEYSLCLHEGFQIAFHEQYTNYNNRQYTEICSNSCIRIVTKK